MKLESALVTTRINTDNTSHQHCLTNSPHTSTPTTATRISIREHDTILENPDKVLAEQIRQEEELLRKERRAKQKAAETRGYGLGASGMNSRRPAMSASYLNDDLLEYDDENIQSLKAGAKNKRKPHPSAARRSSARASASDDDDEEEEEDDDDEQPKRRSNKSRKYSDEEEEDDEGVSCTVTIVVVFAVVLSSLLLLLVCLLLY